MEIYSFNEKEMLDKYNKLLQIFSSAPSEEKASVYGQLQGLKDYLVNHKVFLPQAPCEYAIERIKYIENKEAVFKELDELTSKICYYWCLNLRKISGYNKSELLRKTCSKEEFYLQIKNFFKTIFPNDLSLVEDTFNNGKILVKRTLFSPKAEMLYLPSLREYYIKILSSRKLNMQDVRNTIHEFGHVSEFMANGLCTSKDFVMEEVLANLYELLFIDYYSNSNKEFNLFEFGRLFKTINIYSLDYGFLLSPYQNTLYRKYISEIEFLYDCVISLTLFSKKDEPDFYDKVQYIKDNNPYIPFLELLENIGIKEDDLIYTSKHMKELILSR